jgi:hypothetical protein
MLKSCLECKKLSHCEINPFRTRTRLVVCSDLIGRELEEMLLRELECYAYDYLCLDDIAITDEQAKVIAKVARRLVAERNGGVACTEDEVGDKIKRELEH